MRLRINLPVLLTLLVLLAVLPGFITALIFADSQRQQALTNVQAQNLSYLRLVSLNQSQIVANTKSLLALLAAAPDVRNRDKAGCQSLLDGVVQSSNRFYGIAALDENKQSWCFASANTSPSITETTDTAATTNPELPALGRTMTITDGVQGSERMYQRSEVSKDFTIGEYFVGQVSGRSFLALTQPVLDDTGMITGHMLAGLSLDALNASIQALDLPAGYIVTVLDRRGTVLVRWPTPSLVGQNYADYPLIQQVLRDSVDGTEHTAVLTGVDGVDRLYAFRSVPGTPERDLFVLVGIAPEVAYTAIDNDLRRYLAVLSIFTLVAAVGAWVFGSRRIVAPVRQIVVSTQQIGKGDFSARVQLSSDAGELSLLAQNFNAMATQLEQNTRELNQRAEELNQANIKLEQRVEQRTRQLQSTVDRLRESREQLRQLSTQQRRAVEAEQTRIAREVHDQIGQALTSIKFDVSSGRKKLAAAFPQALDLIGPKLTSIDAELDQAVNTARSIARSLRPTALDTLGLAAAIEVFAQEFETRTGIACRVDVDGDDQTVAPELATAIYRIMQEAMTNVVRHAKASQVVILLYMNADAVKLNVEDNGAGIPEEKLNNFTSLGLLGMQERAHEFGGTVEVTSVAGQGTTLVAVLRHPTPPT
jgi:signal transduction histidine kinase